MTIDRPTAARWRCTAMALALVLCACGQENRYVAPPPPKVTVAIPVQQKVTRYLEATGYASAINTTNLVARVQGFLQKINYKDGDLVKEGATLFVIEPEPYKLKLEQARAAQVGAQATLKQTEAEYERQAELASRQVASKQALDNATANRDSARARLKQAEVDTAQAELNLGYTEVKAPFDGIVTARQVSLGELVGANGPTHLATIVQTAPIYVNFNIKRAGGAEHSRGHAAARHDRGGAQAVPDRSRTADRQRISVSGHAELRFSLHRPCDRNACRARHLGEFGSGVGAGQLRARAGWCRRRAGVPAGAGCRARQRSGRALPARARPQQHGRAAQGHDRPQGRRPARDRERAQAGRSHRRRRYPAGDPRSEGRSAARDRRSDAGAGRERQIAAAP